MNIVIYQRHVIMKKLLLALGCLIFCQSWTCMAGEGGVEMASDIPDAPPMEEPKSVRPVLKKSPGLRTNFVSTIGDLNEDLVQLGRALGAPAPSGKTGGIKSKPPTPMTLREELEKKLKSWGKAG
jgi:hypothetical protein